MYINVYTYINVLILVYVWLICYRKSFYNCLKLKFPMALFDGWVKLAVSPADFIYQFAFSTKKFLQIFHFKFYYKAIDTWKDCSYHCFYIFMSITTVHAVIYSVYIHIYMHVVNVNVTNTYIYKYTYIKVCLNINVDEYTKMQFVIINSMP